MLKIDNKRIPKASDTSVINCDKKFQGCGFINRNDVNTCISCGRILKCTNKNTEGKVLTFGQSVLFYQGVIRSGTIISIIDDEDVTDVMIRLEEKPWDSQLYDQRLNVQEVFTDVNNICSNLLPQKRQRKEKKIFDPDADNLHGEFVGNTVYTSKKKVMKSTMLGEDIEGIEETEETEVIDESSKELIEPTENQHESLSTDMAVENSESKLHTLEVTMEESSFSLLMKNHNPNKELETDTLKNKQLINHPQKTGGVAKRKPGRPKRDSPNEANLGLRTQHNEADQTATEDGKRKRKKKEMYDPNILPGRVKGAKYQTGNENSATLNVVFTNRPLSFLLSIIDLKANAFIERSFHGHYLDEHIKRALLYSLYNWARPPTLTQFEVLKGVKPKRDISKKLDISILEIQEILLFCPVDTKELFSMKSCKRLLGVQLTADSTIGKELTDRIRKFLLERSCYDSGLNKFLHPYNSNYLTNNHRAPNTSIHQLKNLNLTLPLSWANLKVIMEHLTSISKDTIECDTIANQIIESTSLGKSSVYLQLGSGSGMEVLQIAALVGCRCYGVEKNETAYLSACQLVKDFDAILESLNASDRLSSLIEFVNADILDQDQLLTSSTVIYLKNEINSNDDIIIEFSAMLRRMTSFASLSVKQIITAKNLVKENVTEEITPSRSIEYNSNVLGIYHIDSFSTINGIIGYGKSASSTNGSIAVTGTTNNEVGSSENVVVVEEVLTISHETICRNNPSQCNRTYSNGATYTGQIKDGLRHGYGLITYPPLNPSQRMKYYGDWQFNKIHGNGTMIWSGGETYEGEWNNEIKHGIGKYTWPDGKTYEGQWRQGYMSGKGILHYSKQGKMTGRLLYDGEFSMDIPHGKGVIIFEDGKKYEGGIARHTMSGAGVLSYPVGDIRNRSVYGGSFLNDNFEGHGILKYVDGKKYEGKWVAGKKNGPGILHYAKDDSKKRVKYEGTFQRDKILFGCMTYNDNIQYHGKWKADLPDGRGCALFNNVTYDGYWLQGLPHNEGTLIDNKTNNIIKKGEWKAGKFVSDNSDTIHEELFYFRNHY